MILGNFSIQPKVTLCNNLERQTLLFNFSSNLTQEKIESLQINNYTSLQYISEGKASASAILACKKNLTYYKFKLYSEGNQLSSVSYGDVLAIAPFSLTNYL